MSNCMWLTQLFHKNLPGRQFLLISCRAGVGSVFFHTSHKTVRQNKLNLSLSHPPPPTAISICINMHFLVSDDGEIIRYTYTPADVTQDWNRVTEQQFQHFGTSSWNSSALRANSLDSVVGNTRDVETEFKGPCPLGAICRAISTVFLGVFSPLSLMRRQHMPQHAVAYRKTSCTQRLLSLSSSLSGHRRPKLWEMFWVKNIQAFHKAVVVITVGPFFFFSFFVLFNCWPTIVRLRLNSTTGNNHLTAFVKEMQRTVWVFSVRSDC